MAAMLVSACAGGPATGSPAAGDGALAWRMPAVNPVTYAVADTSTINMNMSGMNIDVNVRAAATVEIAFAEQNDGLVATVSYITLSGEFTNSMGPSMTVDESMKPGPAVIAVGPRGALTVLQKPEMAETVAEILGDVSGYQRLFVRLPGRNATTGTVWVDTVETTDAGGMTSTTRQIITSRLTGDTTVNGRRLQVIRSDIAATVRISGSNAGVEVLQNLTGTSNATTLWDAQRRVMVERIESGTMTGSMDLPGMGVTGVPVTAQSRQMVRLQT